MLFGHAVLGPASRVSFLQVAMRKQDLDDAMHEQAWARRRPCLYLIDQRIDNRDVIVVAKVANHLALLLGELVFILERFKFPQGIALVVRLGLARWEARVAVEKGIGHVVLLNVIPQQLVDVFDEFDTFMVGSPKAS